MEACHAAVWGCTESTVTLRVATGFETGALIVVYVDAAKCQVLSSEWRKANAKLAILRDQHAESIRMRHAQILVRPPGAQQRIGHTDVHLRLREDARRQEHIAEACRRVVELEGEATVARNHAFRLGLSTQHHNVKHHAGYFACNLKYGLTWTQRRLALAAMTHSRLWALPLNIDVTRCIANFLASHEAKHRADPLSGPFTPCSFSPVLAAEDRPTGKNAADYPRHLLISAASEEELIISGLQPGTPFIFTCQVWSPDPEQKSWYSEVLEASTQLAPWQQLLQRAGLSEIEVLLSRTPRISTGAVSALYTIY